MSHSSPEYCQEPLPMMVDVNEVVGRIMLDVHNGVELDTSEPKEKQLGRALDEAEQLPLTSEEHQQVTDNIIKQHGVSDRALRRQKIFSETEVEKKMDTALARLKERGIPPASRPDELVLRFKVKRAAGRNARLGVVARIALRESRILPPPPPPPSVHRYGR